ncbi:TMV resistance protein N-like [Neltuma alba]|uniref:TMV resistance protein N-like n=1 Tax=Neltuma alba TaxID=207710 RepID=UPI0010A46CA7|nr:TMV resistance protein N-like [Prosopis alba]
MMLIIVSRIFNIVYRQESTLIKTIVKHVSDKLDIGQLFVAENSVGMESRVHELTIEWSQNISQKALIIGLWGMRGIGKTTVAKAIYNKMGRQFEARSFLANIRENSKHANDQVNLQKQLISDITKTQVFKIANTDRGKKIIQERFPDIKAFVVLDDVDSVNQLNTLCGSLKWFCSGSIIIITTRDLHMLNVLKADHKYGMRGLNETESLNLFSWHAFKQAAPFENFTELSKNAVTYCGGLPLALEVLGSHLFDREIEEWEYVLSKLERIPNDERQAKLKVSFEGLEHGEEYVS